MIKLDSPDLPTTVRPIGRSAPIARLFTGENQVIAPIARFNLFAQYQNPGFAPTGMTTPLPDYLGKLFRIDVGATISSASLVQQGQQQFGFTANPLAISPNRYWLDGTTLNLYGTTSQLAGDSLVLNGAIESVAFADEVTAGRYTVTLPTGFVASQVLVQGLGFAIAANPASPVVGEFVQVGTLCTLTSTVEHEIADFSQAIVTGVGTYALPEPTLAIATFDLSGSGIVFVDGIDFHGIAFKPSLVPANPAPNDFFWRSPLLTCFFDVALLGDFTAKDRTQLITQKNLSVVTYQGVM